MDLVDQGEVGVERVALEAREPPGGAGVALLQRLAGDRAGEQAAAAGRVGHQPDAELAERGRMSSSRSRVNSEYSLCRAVIGWVAWPRRMVSAPASESPT
jgi:hypothetical protein